MKKNLYYILILFFAVNGAGVMLTNPQFSFYWWMGIINVAGFGGYLIFKLLDYLKP